MKNFRALLNELGLDWRKELLFFGVCSLVFIAMAVLLYLWKGFGFLLLFPVLAYLVFSFYFFTRYGASVRRKKEELNREFVNIFTFFGIFITDGFTVYNALEQVKNYASEDFAERLETLLRGIDEDKSVTPFVEFAKGFEDVSVKEVMLAVYQMVDEGGGGVYIRQFQKLFGRLSDTRHRMDETKRLSRLDTLSFLPLAGSGLAMLALTLSIMEIMGGLMNVL
ncbi:MAG: hypothetical protein IJ787_01510 [Bacilli bacterium]|nr:hypothetical protein [Bacilli bacterium]